ncbi:hypothetical protein O181_037658 [Austropuccinia psidii MF-1]|uniref:Uncharacterized protein n=1 Tax=Austropuccinia psidii MF-1 TaxID=1389203 RepID=A0A9Q3D9W0_9BASI|nr:hypothetical protein [Austropuccinia psidii MF-1]
MDPDYGPQAIEAVGGLNGLFGPFRPGPPLMKRVGPKPMMRARVPKNKDRGLGVEDMEISHGRVIWPKGHRAPEGAKLAIKIWCGQLAPAWSQTGIAATPIEEVHSLWL